MYRLLTAPSAAPAAHLALAHGWITRLQILRESDSPAADFPSLPPLQRPAQEAGEGGESRPQAPTGAVAGVDECGDVGVSDTIASLASQAVVLK